MFFCFAHLLQTNGVNEGNHRYLLLLNSTSGNYTLWASGRDKANYVCIVRGHPGGPYKVHILYISWSVVYI